MRKWDIGQEWLVLGGVRRSKKKAEKSNYSKRQSENERALSMAS